MPTRRRLTLRREKLGKFVARHALAGFLTGAGSAMGVLAVKLWFG
jgi:hypothetical protein